VIRSLMIDPVVVGGGKRVVGDDGRLQSPTLDQSTSPAVTSLHIGLHTVARAIITPTFQHSASIRRGTPTC
jgi:hypothetical protein